MALEEAGIEVRDMRPTRPRMEEAFISLIRHKMHLFIVTGWRLWGLLFLMWWTKMMVNIIVSGSVNEQSSKCWGAKCP